MTRRTQAEAAAVHNRQVAEAQAAAQAAATRRAASAEQARLDAQERAWIEAQRRREAEQREAEARAAEQEATEAAELAYEREVRREASDRTASAGRAASSRGDWERTDPQIRVTHSRVPVQSSWRAAHLVNMTGATVYPLVQMPDGRWDEQEALAYHQGRRIWLRTDSIVVCVDNPYCDACEQECCNLNTLRTDWHPTEADKERAPRNFLRLRQDGTIGFFTN